MLSCMEAVVVNIGVDDDTRIPRCGKSDGLEEVEECSRAEYAECLI